MASVDFYYSFRSPYSYLALPQIEALRASHEVEIAMRVVYPIAVRIPGFFKRVNPLWPPYLARDTWRLAQFHGIPYSWPKPDPIVMDIGSGEVPAEQPYIGRISRMGVAATEAGKGLEYIGALARKIWSGKYPGWNEGSHVADAAREAGLDPDTLELAAERDKERLEGVIAANEAAQTAAGHWGVPLFVFEGEPFFGQDRIELLKWRLEAAGVKRR